MGDIVQFVPRRELDAIGNLAAFVQLCRLELSVFGANLEWDKNDWDITAFIEARGRKGRLALVFSNYDTAGPRNVITYMALDYRNFAKAYMRYQQSLKPTKDFNRRMAALRALEKILIDRSLDGIPRIGITDPDILNAAAALVKRDVPASAYWIGSQLEIIANFLVDHRLSNTSFFWRNPNRKPINTTIRVGAESEKRRSEKLPSAEAIDALIEAYRKATEPRDVITTSIAALLVCSPDRINEVFRLPVLCEHRAKYNGQDAYGIRWWPSKGAEPMIKWVIKSMEDIAHEAIENLTKHTEEARNMARWYESNPGKVYLAKGYEYLRTQEFLKASEISEIIGLSSSSKASEWLKANGVPAVKQEKRAPGQAGVLPYLFKFKDFEKAIVALLPKGFPVLDQESKLRYSGALILVPQNLFHAQRGTSRCMFETVGTDTFNDQLGSGEKHGKSSVFSRLELKDADGNSFKISSHQFRHWLNTIAQNAGLSQLHIAKWSGRKDIRQNATYNHVTGGELIARARELSGGRLFGPIADFVMHAPMSKDEFLKLAFPTAHVTEYGYCIHDWTMAPCEKYRDCLLCTDHLCVKGNFRTEGLVTRLAQAEELLARAKVAVGEGFFGADRWLEHHMRIVEVLQGHKEIREDPAIPADSVYQLSGIREYSPVSRAIEDRMNLDDPDAAALRLVMERLSSLGHQTQPLALPIPEV
jgi:hypothetical protein